MLQRIRLLRCVAITAVILLYAGSLHALNPGTQLSQYGHTAWRLQDGLLSSPPSSITQTGDGYIWIGTDTGLLRFDGVKFTPWQEATGQPPIDGPVISLLGASDGGLWIGTEKKLAHWDGKQLLTYKELHSSIVSIREDSSKAIWLARFAGDTYGPLCRVSKGQLKCFRKDDGILTRQGYSLALDASGGAWIAGIGALTSYKEGVAREFRFPVGMKTTLALAIDPQGRPWLGSEVAWPNLGLQYLDNGTFHRTRFANVDFSKLSISTMMFDLDGSLWIGTNGDGMYRLKKGKVEHFGSSDGLSGNTVEQFFQDKEGDIWVVTAKGIDRFRDLEILSYSFPNIPSSDSPSAVQAMRDGSIWASTRNGEIVLHGDSVSVLSQGHGLPGRTPGCMSLDSQGRVLLGVDNGLYRYEKKRFTKIAKLSPSSSWVNKAREDQEGDIWIVQWNPTPGPGNAVYRIEPSVLATRKIEMPGGIVWDWASDSEAGLWMLFAVDGSKPPGLGHFQHGHLETINHRWISENHPVNMLIGPENTVYLWAHGSLLLLRGNESRTVANLQDGACGDLQWWSFDEGGNLWVGSRCGLTRFEREEVRQWWDQPGARKLNRLVLDASDGFSTQGNMSEPRASVAPDGKLWFLGESGLLSLNPSHQALNSLPPPVHVEAVFADRQRLPLRNNARLPVRTRDLEIDYAALSFPNPQKVLFRYKLDGHDKAWLDAGTRRQAFYSDLSPGHYTFHVIACNNSGVWNETGDSLRFDILPAWYQRLWFEAVCAFAVMILLWVFVKLRVRRAELAVTSRFATQMSERMRIARELHDTLLQSLQGLILSFSNISAQVQSAKATDLLRVGQEMDGALDQAEGLLISGRERIRELRTFSNDGKTLLAELQALVGQIDCETGPKIDIQVDENAQQLAILVQEEVVWIMREALANACQHSGASRIFLEVSRTRAGLRCAIQDNGKGIDLHSSPKPGHFGIVGMHERAQRTGGRLQILSSPGSRTLVTLSVPARIAFERKRSWIGRLFSLSRPKELS